MKDFRDELDHTQQSKVTALFGTSNNLFEEQEGTERHEYAESCQYSSAVWCRTVISEGPDVKVHTQEAKVLMIDALFDQLHPSEWVWNSDCHHPKNTTITGSVANGQAYHNRIVFQLLGLLNPTAGAGQRWTRINTKAVISHDAGTILNYATTANQKATLIQMKSHCFAIYFEKKGEIFAFDNTVGCLRFDNDKLLKKFVLWAAGKKLNGELLPSADLLPPWTAVTCW